MLREIRHYVNETTIRSICYAIFQSNLSYVCTIFGQTIKYNNRIVSYKGTRRELFFLSDFNEHTAPLFSKAKMLKFIDFIQIENCIF